MSQDGYQSYQRRKKKLHKTIHKINSLFIIVLVQRKKIIPERFPLRLPICLIRRRHWHPTPVLLPGKSHGWRSLEGCSPWGCWGSDTTEQLPFHFSLSCIGEGNGNPLQCSCLGNPRDGGAWWAAVYGVTQSWTRLKWLSICLIWASLVAQRVKHLLTMQETWVRSLGWEDPLEKEMASHSSTLAWKIPWTEKPGRLQSMGSQRVGYDWATSLYVLFNRIGSHAHCSISC